LVFVLWKSREAQFTSSRGIIMSGKETRGPYDKIVSEWEEEKRHSLLRTSAYDAYFGMSSSAPFSRPLSFDVDDSANKSPD
jgi:hypothetical protein